MELMPAYHHRNPLPIHRSTHPTFRSRESFPVPPPLADLTACPPFPPQGYGSDLPTIALKLAAEPKRSGTRARVVVFTQGAESTIVAYNGKVTTYPVEKLEPELLVDTNGTQYTPIPLHTGSFAC